MSHDVKGDGVVTQKPNHNFLNTRFPQSTRRSRFYLRRRLSGKFQFRARGWKLESVESSTYETSTRLALKLALIKRLQATKQSRHSVDLCSGIVRRGAIKRPAFNYAFHDNYYASQCSQVSINYAALARELLTYHALSIAHFHCRRKCGKLFDNIISKLKWMKLI